MNIIEGVAFVSFTGMLTVLTITDFRKRSISVVALIVMLLLSLFLGLYGKKGIEHILLGTVPGIVTIIIAVLTKGKIGMGDALVLSALGIWCGPKMILSIYFAALLLCSIAGIAMIILKIASRKTALPFIPFILAGYIICEVTSRLAV